MAWIAEDRRATRTDTDGPFLTDALRRRLTDVYLPRYPTKRAVLLPALHAVQHEHGWLPPGALREVAEFLELAPAEVWDTASFYEEYWLKPKGKYLLQVCRSLPCQLCGHKDLSDAIKRKLDLDEFETTADGRFTFVELECLGACGTAPVMLVNEVLHENVTPAFVEKLIDELPDDPHDYRDLTVPESGAH